MRPARHAARPSHHQPAGESFSPAGALSAGHPRLRAAARLAYVAVILFATLPGTGWSSEPWLVSARLRRALHPSFSPADVLDAVRNVALFAGLGVAWIATTRTRRLWPPVWRATAAGALVSLMVEITQLTSPVRYASALDLATNAVGAFVGALGTAAVIRVARWELERAAAGRRADDGGLPVPWALVAAAYAGAAALEALSPLGAVDRVPGAAGGVRTRLRASLAWSAAHLDAPAGLLDVLLFAPAGALAALALRAYGASSVRSAAGGALACAAAFAIAEVARGATGGDMRPLPLLAHVGGAAAAALLVAWAGRRRRAATPGPGAAFAAAAGVLVLWYWRPFSLRSGLVPGFSPDNLVPLRALLQLFTIHSVADVVVDFLLFAALGAWLSVRPLRSRGPFRGPAPALWLAATLEIGQGWVAGRYADVTDLAVQWAGVLVAWAVVRQARLRAVA